MKINRDSAAKCRVLIADDDQKVRALLSELLEAEGYEVFSASDGGSARAAVTAFQPEVVISDVVMPVMNGIELCCLIKKDPKTSDIPVLLISGLRNAPEDSLEGLTAGADDYLNVPFRNEELLVKVARLAERHHAHQVLRESEQRYRRLVELSPEGIVVHSAGKIIYVNPAGQRLWGADKPEELVGQSILDRVHPDYHDTVNQRVRQVLLEGSPTDLIEQRHKRLDGEVIDVEVAGMPFVVNGEPAVQVVMRDITGRNRDREALRQTETQLRTVIGSAAMALFVINLEGVFTLAEGEGLKNLNLKPSALLGQSVFDLYRDDPRILENVRRALKGEIFSDALEVGELTFETRYSPLADDAGNVTGAVWVATDVTENRKAQNALREKAELFEMVAKAKSEWETTFDSMSDGIFIFDPSGHLKRVNRAGAAMENSEPRNLLGWKCCDILRTSSEMQTCLVEKAIAEGRSLIIEVVPTRLNRPILVSIEPVLDRAGSVTAAVCTARDLSELRKVQAVAREHQSLLTNILESARESIYAVDVDGRFKWCNSATLSGLGYKREEFIGTRFLDMVYEGDREVADEKLQTAMNGQAQTYEMRYFAADGRLRYARVDNSPLIVDGKTTGVLGIARDITEQKEERERAARADKLRALGQLASGVAHDFNNSLAAILGRAQLLRRQTQDEALVRNVEIIQTAAEDAAATVRRIQTFARKSQAKEFERLELSGLLNDAIEITRTRWQNEARLRGLEYDVMLNADKGHYTFGSASELREVFVNLIVNAVDAMPKGGKLKISCVADKARLRLQFADNGTGMPEDVRQKIFDPFFTTKGAHGTGLGLSVSYSIIERHEGMISVASNPGEGTVFTIELPASEMASESAAAPVNNVELPKLSILVIDDEPAVRETLAEMLELMGHRVVLADSGQSALQLLGANECELVFTDLAMPDMDGWETTREIRKRWPEMNVVLVTGYGSGTLPPVGEDNLVDGIIGKPFDFSQINQTITSIVANQALLESAPL